MTEQTCRARYLVRGENGERDALVQCQDGEMATHPRVRDPEDPDRKVWLHHAWTPLQPRVEWLDSQSEPEHDETCRHEDDDAVSLGEPEAIPMAGVEPAGHVHECGHTDADHLRGEGMPPGLSGLLAAIFGGQAPEPEPEPERDPMDVLLESLRQMQDVHAAVLGAAQAHRERCEAAGFSPTAAEALAWQFYQQAIGKA